MRKAICGILVALIAFLGVAQLSAQNSERPAYLNTALPAEQRASDLVHRMTVEEKVTQLVLTKPRFS